MKKIIYSLLFLVLQYSQIFCQQDSSKNFISIWEGKLNIQNISLRITLRIWKNSDGTLGAYLDSHDQGVNDIPINSIILSEDSLIFTSQNIGASYAGKIEKDSMVAVGKFKQASFILDLNLKKVEKAIEVRRPQNPQKPYPYNEEEVEFENNAAGIKLAGTFTYPKREGQFPTVILVTGSGPQDRNENILNHKPFLVIADYLTRNGVAVLRYDDRGVGNSTGNFGNATTEDFLQDALAAVDYLKSRKEVNSNKIGIVGHSEGGMVATMGAAKSKDLGFIVLLGGPGATGKDLLLLQGKLIMKASGTNDDEIEKNLKINEELYNIVVNSPDSIIARQKFEEWYSKIMNPLSDEEKKKPENSRANFEEGVKALQSPWIRFFLKYNPQPFLKKIKIPVLALNGEKDLQVESKQNLTGIESALKSGGNKNYKAIELPSLNHLFQTAKTGAPTEYGEIEETFSPTALNIIGDWIKEISKNME